MTPPETPVDALAEALNGTVGTVGWVRLTPPLGWSVEPVALREAAQAVTDATNDWHLPHQRRRLSVALVALRAALGEPDATD